MKPSEGENDWVPGVTYIIGLTVVSLFLLLSGSVIQYHWRLRMDDIVLFFGQAIASKEQIAFLFGVTLSFAAAVVFTSEVVHRRRGWLLVLAGLVISLPLIATSPLTITYSIVWSGVAVNFLVELTLGTGSTPIIGAAFLVVLAVNAILWTFLSWDSSRNLKGRLELFIRGNLREKER